MGVSGRKSRNDLVQVQIEGRSQPTIKTKISNTVLIQKNEPIRYTLAELRQIKGKGEVCYMIRKLRLNRRSVKKKKLNKQEVKEERGVLKSHLLEIKTEKSLGLDMTSRSFTLILRNVQSIKNKQDIITELLEDSNADLAVLTETWLTDADDIWVQGSEFHRHNYKIDECHRKDRKERGLALVTKQNLKVKREEHRITAELEYAKWKVTSANSFLNILDVYRPPDGSTPQFLDNFMELLVDILTSNTNLVVLGDFNIHVNDIHDPNGSIFLDTMTAL